jgi:hypothetical protein
MILPNKVGSALSKIAFLRAAPAVGSGRGQQATMKFAKLRQSLSSISGSDITKPDLLQRCHRHLKHEDLSPNTIHPWGIRQVNGK